MNYAGSSKYEATSNSTVYKVNSPTSIFIYSRNGDKKGSTIKVSGKLLCNDEGVKGEKISIKVNEKSYTATTGGYGYFTVNHTITNYDNLNITMSYAGSSKYEATSNSTVYKVKQPTNIYMYSRSNDKVGSTIKVSGKLQYNNGEGIKGEKVKINVNGKTYNTTTGGYGYFTVNYTIPTNKNLNVTFTYDGSKTYEASKNSTNYTVVKGSTKITINSVSNISYNKNVTITGKLTDNNNNPLKRTKIRVNFNGVEKQVTTDDNGFYTYTNQTNKVGSNTITVNFTENNDYLSSNSKITFKVINKPTILDFDVFDVEYGEDATITGYLVDNDLIDLINTPVTININGVNYSTKTDSNGYFYYQYKSEIPGLNNVTVSFEGTDLYSPSSANKSFTVNKTHIKIIIDTVVTAIQGKPININLMILDPEENTIEYSEMLVKINDERFEVTTDKYGEYTLKYTPNKIGKNIINITYLGNEKFGKSYATDNFTVVKPQNITLTITQQTQESPVGSDTFQTWYQTDYNQSNPGVYLHIYSANTEDMGSITENLVINATFYFKDNKGNVITRQFTDGDGTHMYHPLLTGFTPFKVDATYFKMTSYEISLLENGYLYDAQSGEWYNSN